MKIKILHIFSGYGGGISSLILNLVENSSDKIEHSLLAFSYDGGEIFQERIERCGGKLFLMTSPRKGGYKAFFNSVNEVFKHNKYDAVHCHIDGKPLPIFKIIADLNGVSTLIVHAHKTKYESAIDRNPIIHAFNRWCNYQFSSAYMTCSQMAADYIFGKSYQQKRHSLLIPNGIDETRYGIPLSKDEVDKYRKEFDICGDELIIGHVGRISAQKNHVFILQLMKALKEKKVKFKFIDVGDGELFDEVRLKIKEFGLSGNVKFVGRRNDIPQLMQFFDLMILPSLSEGLPTVAVECQSAGTPMFLSDAITNQCDMHLGLVKFISLNIDLWVKAIQNFHRVKLNPENCVAQIKSNGFTAKSAGETYAAYVNSIINKP